MTARKRFVMSSSGSCAFAQWLSLSLCHIPFVPAFLCGDWVDPPYCINREIPSRFETGFLPTRMMDDCIGLKGSL